ncbi:hypothetical protein [Desulfosarcina cetonica]|uniref:hypothetical protein n=1 Tax=Desulfosarcina cetonica TaxID=90730 RepID=UPI001C495DCB|nr:hypothetical protein [Desulfosarcina cetonica]
MAAPSRTDISDDVLIALRRLIRAIDLHSRYLSKHFGLTGPQLIILRDWYDPVKCLRGRSPSRSA